MLPTELPKRSLSVPGTVETKLQKGAVYFSGPSLRHRRLGYLLQHTFPALMQAWFIIQPKPRSKSELLYQARQRLIGDAKFLDVAKLMNRRRLHRLIQKTQDIVGTQIYKFDYRKTEQRMFGAEVERLASGASIQPEFITNGSDPKLNEYFKIRRPYFLITFGGPLLGRSIIEQVDGVAINQHAGVSPQMKGSHTVEMALYHRRLDWVGTTVHLMDTFADSGDILRRSLSALHEGDTVAESFFSVTALGNQLVLESIREIMENEAVDVFPQPKGVGDTVLSANLNAYRRRDVLKNSRSVIRAELTELRDF